MELTMDCLGYRLVAHDLKPIKTGSCAGIASSSDLASSFPEFGDSVWRLGRISTVRVPKHISSRHHKQAGCDWSALSYHLHRHLHSSHQVHVYCFEGQ